MQGRLRTILVVALLVVVPGAFGQADENEVAESPFPDTDSEKWRNLPKHEKNKAGERILQKLIAGREYFFLYLVPNPLTDGDTEIAIARNAGLFKSLGISAEQEKVLVETARIYSLLCLAGHDAPVLRTDGKIYVSTKNRIELALGMLFLSQFNDRMAKAQEIPPGASAELREKVLSGKGIGMSSQHVGNYLLRFA